MKIEEVTDKLVLRVHLGGGECDGEKFRIAMTMNGGLMVEFEKDKYLVPAEEIIKEVIKWRAKNQRGK